MSTNKNELSKKPIWFLFLGANILVLLACVITWIIVSKSQSNLTLWFLPTLICNLLSLVLAGLFGYFEIKDFAPQVMHFRRKWLRFYIAAFAVYVCAILFNVLYFLFYLQKIPNELAKNILGSWQLWIYLVITMVLSLVSVGLQRYARFRIDLDIYRRKHGQNEAQKEAEKNEQKEAKNEPQKDPKKTDEKPTKSQASGGLLDQME